MTATSARKRAHPSFIGALIGAIVGSLFGAWTLASQPPDRAVAVSRVEPPGGSVSCPEGYARAASLDSSVGVEGTHARYIARCDPIHAQASISESLELLYAPEIQLDPRARNESLTTFVRALSHSSHLLLEPLQGPSEITVASAHGLVVEADGAYRVPALTTQIWAIPAGRNTLQVSAVSPRDHADIAAHTARETMEHVVGLQAWDASQPGTRAWSVQVNCPAGYTDATPPDGGRGASAYLGRYCISPSDDGGIELTFVELPGVAADSTSAARFFRLAATSTSAVGVNAGTGFGPVESVHIANFDGFNSSMNVEPPVARIHLRAYELPAGRATLFALATTMQEHATSTVSILDQWIEHASVVRSYDAALLSDFKVSRAIKAILAPALVTALLGAILGFLRARGLLRLSD